MMDFGIADFVALSASFATLISIFVNVIQWLRKKDLVVALKSRSQASYNYFFNIAYRSDYIRELPKKEKINVEEKLEIALRQAYGITGIADAARNDIISYCREHLNFIPLDEHPANPIIGPLPKAGENAHPQTQNKDYPRWKRNKENA